MADNTVLIRNARIWISSKPDANWMLFDKKSGRVLDIGTGEPKNDSNAGEIIDLAGNRVFPGFLDSHIHVSWTGWVASSTQLKDCYSINDFTSRIKCFGENNTDKVWVTGIGWEQDKIGRYPNRFDIDEVCSDRPAMFHRICAHIGVANSKALEMAGITKDTPNPENGIIDRFAADHAKAGEPTGILREFPALDLIKTHIQTTRAEKLLWIASGLDLCLKNGVTAVQTIEENTWTEYKDLVDQQRLPIRVFISADNADRYKTNFPRPEESHGPLLSCDRVKIYADGGLGGSTAAVSVPYKCQHQCGLLLQSQETLNKLVHEATASGYRLEIHVIGDRAAESAICALEHAQVTPEKRPILTHCQLLREELVQRMKPLGAIANIQPQFVTTDARWLDGLLPDELLPWAYAWKSLLRHGIVCAGGSDSPVESPEPLIGIYDAIFRPNGSRCADKQESFKPEECLSIKEAVDLYTIAGAYTARREHDLGQLLPGYYADFVVLADGCDPVNNSKLFLTAKIEQVWVAGNKKL